MYVDGVYQGRYDVAESQFGGLRDIAFSLTGLPLANHTVDVRKVAGAYMLADAAYTLN